MLMAELKLSPIWNMPMARPPTRFMPIITMAAIASPRMNFEAPSMAP